LGGGGGTRGQGHLGTFHKAICQHFALIMFIQIKWIAATAAAVFVAAAISFAVLFCQKLKVKSNFLSSL